MKTISRLLVVLLITTFLFTDPGSAAPSAAAITVTTLVDELEVNGVCSLREAVESVNKATYTGDCTLSGSGAVTIMLPAGTYNLDLSPGTAEDNNQTGDLDIWDNVSITGAGQAETIIDGNGNDRVFDIWEGYDITVMISNLTIQNGHAVDGNGGGIRNIANLTLDGVIVQNNQTAYNGGGIYHKSNHVPGSPTLGVVLDTNTPQAILAPAILTLQNSTVTENTAISNGGGIMNNVGSNMSIEHSVISNNQSDFDGDGTGDGGGIYNGSELPVAISFSEVLENSAGHGFGGGLYTLSLDGADVTITDTLFSGNAAPSNGGGNIYHIYGAMGIYRSEIVGGIATWGGGLVTAGASSLTRVENVTFSNNQATGGVNQGGAVYIHSGDAEIVHATIVNNIADFGAGIYHVGDVVTIKGTIVAANFTSGAVLANFSGYKLNSQGYNLTDGGAWWDPLVTGDMINTDPLLGDYGLHGSLNPTSSFSLLPGSPAIDAADPASGPDLDQRGRRRPVDGNLDGIAIRDIGAFEVQLACYLPLVLR
jgi:CSLREA domain-containing protein